jgi:predicted nucleic acid-binding protein
MALNDSLPAGGATISMHGCGRGLGSRFEGRILPVDLGIADACGRLVARSESMGRPIEPRDALIAATAEVHSLTLVTRNASDFETTVKGIVTPWI